MPKVLSIDPGINNTGAAIVEFNDGVYTVLDCINIKTNRKLNEEEKEIEAKHGLRATKIYSIVSEIEALLLKHDDIQDIVIEAPFYNSFTPNAYGSLLEVFCAIKYLVVIPKDKRLRVLEPLLIKKIFTTKSTSAKEVIKEFLYKKVKDSELRISLDIESLTEHQIDAIATGYAYLFRLNLQSLSENTAVV